MVAKDAHDGNRAGDPGGEGNRRRVTALAAMTALEGVAALVLAIATIPFGGEAPTDDRVVMTPYATSILLAVLGLMTLAVAAATWRGSWWGWGWTVTVNICLIPVAIYLTQGGKALVAVPVAIVAAVTLALAFSRGVLRAKAEKQGGQAFWRRGARR